MQSFPLAPMIASVVVLVVAILLLVAAIIVVKLKSKGSLVSLFVGMAVFAVCFVIAIISSSVLSIFVSNLLVATIILSLRAGVVEELGRYLAFKVFLKKRNCIGDALLYGLGHGGMEVLLVLGLSAVNVLVIGFMINAGMYDVLAQGLDATALAAFDNQLQTLTSAGAGMFALSGVERLWAVIVHVSFSIMVFCSARQRKVSYLILAILLHFGFDCTTYLYHAEIVPVEIFELLLGVIALGIGAVGVVFARRYIAWYEAQEQTAIQTSL